MTTIAKKIEEWVNTPEAVDAMRECARRIERDREWLRSAIRIEPELMHRPVDDFRSRR